MTEFAHQVRRVLADRDPQRNGRGAILPLLLAAASSAPAASSSATICSTRSR